MCPAVTDRAGLKPAFDLGALRGDVDGDGRRDHVFLSVLGSGPPRCRYVLVVDRGHARSVVAIRGGALARLPRRDVARYLRLDALIALLPRGLDIVVNIDRGASTDFVGIFTMSGGELRRRRVLGTYDDLLWHGGTVTHQAAVDCLGRRSGLIVRNGAGLVVSRFAVERRVYRATRSGLLQLDRSRTQRFRRSRMPTFGRAFGSCAVVRT